MLFCNILIFKTFFSNKKRKNKYPRLTRPTFLYLPFIKKKKKRKKVRNRPIFIQQRLALASTFHGPRSPLFLVLLENILFPNIKINFHIKWLCPITIYIYIYIYVFLIIQWFIYFIIIFYISMLS